MRTRFRLCTVFLLFAVLTVANAAEDWTRFRGPHGSGVSEIRSLPTRWSADSKIAWKTPLPGGGVSSPVLWGDRIFVTAYSGFDRWQRSDEFGSLKLHVVCLKASDGAILWQDAIDSEGKRRRGGYGGTRHHGYASHTPVVDGDAVYAFFGPDGVYAYSHDGKRLWESSVGTRKDSWGTAASPILHDGLLIFNASAESGSLVALDPETGEEVWRQRPLGRTWATPVIAHADGRSELVLNVPGQVRAYDPGSGDPLWWCDNARDYASSSPVVDEGIIYSVVANTHGGSGSVAVRADGSEDVADTHVIWRGDWGAQVSSPGYHAGYVYWSSINPRVGRNGRAVYCADGETGELVYKHKLDPEPKVIYASPLIADGKVYYLSQQAGMYVLSEGPEFELLAHNRIESEPEDSYFNASPVPLEGGRLLLRSDWGLYCIGQNAE